MAIPNVLVLTGYGINCDEETAFAFNKTGAKSERVHINDLIDKNRKLSSYQILAFPGGFSFGDDTGSGNALANRIRNHLLDDVKEFVESDKLAIGICNGFQVMVNLGLIPALDGKYGQREVALVHNDSARYIDRWVDLEFGNHSVWTKGLGTISVPIAHGEGKLHASPEVLEEIKSKGLIAAKYAKGKICEYLGLKANPNGSLEDIAALSDETGRLMGMMPHPERAIFFTQLPNWSFLKNHYKWKSDNLPTEGPGIQIFRNGVNYFK